MLSSTRPQSARSRLGEERGDFAMRPISILAVLFVCLTVGTSAVADVNSDLLAIKADLENTQEQLGKDAPIAPDKMTRAIASLTTMLGGQGLNEAGKSIAYFYRAEARRLLNSIREKNKQP